jgi:sulfur-oxidizing protein SoxZ
MKVKAVAQNNVVSVKILVQHVMETGRRKDETGKLVPGHYITEVNAEHKGERVFQAELGPGVSKDPYLAFQFTGGSVGETVTISWVDNNGGSEKTDSVISAV